MKLYTLIRFGCESILNYLANFRHHQLTYVVEPENWSIKWDGYYVLRGMQGKIPSRFSSSSLFLSNQIIHFGSENTFFLNEKLGAPFDTNKVILTLFHLNLKKNELEKLLVHQNQFAYFHTASTITCNQLINLGFNRQKIVVIPLGVDLKRFKIIGAAEKRKLKQELGLPTDMPIIGSFQKDGVGWGEGMKPKTIKGPDCFVEVIKKIKKYRPFVLLTGPARGYVKKRLEREKIPYKHIFLANYFDLPKFYQCLDLYVVASRIEGGPKAILESFACGVPIVSTKVGLAPDLIIDEVNGMLADIEDINEMARKVENLLTNKKMRDKIIDHAQVTIKNYDWGKIATMYYDKMYKNLL